MNLIITGSSGALGEILSKRFLSLGWKVYGVDKMESVINDKNYIHCIIDFDADNYKTKIDEFFLQSLFSGCINCLGYYGVRNLQSFDMVDVEKSILINCYIPLYFSVKLAQQSKNESLDFIININSAAYQMISRDIGYTLSKSALIGATKSLAKNTSTIRVYSVAPHIFESSMSGQMPIERRSEAINSSIFKEYINKQDLADFIEYLAISGSKYLTGQTFHFNGGTTFV